MTPRWHVRWPDETEALGATAAEVLEVVGRDAWTVGQDVRLALADRAFDWNGADVDPLLPPPEFLQALHDAKCLVIVERHTE